jgi:hypothetical protein
MKANALAWSLAAALVMAVAMPGQESWQVRGRVLSAASNRPLPGAVVTFSGHQATGHALNEAWLEWENPRPVTTDAEGRFVVVLPIQPGPGLADGYPSRLHVRVNADAHVEHFGHVYLSRLFASPTLEFEPVAMSPGRTVELSIADSSGRAQPGCLVRVRQAASSSTPADGMAWCRPVPTVQARADMTGRVRLPSSLAFGKHRLEVVGRELVQSEIEVRRDGVGQFAVTVVPTPRQVAMGRIVDDAGRGIGGVRLWYGKSVGPDQPSTTTDAEGTFWIEGGAELSAQCQLWVSDRGAPWGRRPLATIEIGERAAPIALGARDRAVFRIHGLPAAASHRVALRLLPEAGGQPLTVTKDSVRDEVVVDDVLAGSYLVQAHAIGIGTWPSDWQSCEIGSSDQAIEVRLPELVEQWVAVVDEQGNAVVGARVQGISLQSKAFDSMGDPLTAYCRGDGMSSAFMPWVMSTNGPEEVPLGRTLPVVVTDDKGLARLVAPEHGDRFVIRVTGESSVRTFSIHDRFPVAKGRVEVKVATAGSVVIVGDEKMLRTPRHVLDDTQWRAAREYGPGGDPWGRGVEDVLRQSACGIWLQQRGAGRDLAQDLEWFVPFVAGRNPSWRGVPPGSYDLVLVMRERSTTADAVVITTVFGRPLAQVEVRAGKLAEVTISLRD